MPDNSSYLVKYKLFWSIICIEQTVICLSIVVLLKNVILVNLQMYTLLTNYVPNVF